MRYLSLFLSASILLMTTSALSLSMNGVRLSNADFDVYSMFNELIEEYAENGVNLRSTNEITSKYWDDGVLFRLIVEFNGRLIIVEPPGLNEATVVKYMSIPFFLNGSRGRLSCYLLQI